MRKPKYVQEFTDRHGTVRSYLRRPGHKRIALPGVTWSPEFMKAYEEALKGEPVAIASKPAEPGTIAAVADLFMASAGFLGLAVSTQATYRGIILRIRAEHGHRPVATLTTEKLVELMGRKARTPSAANNWLRLVRRLMQFAIKLHMRASDPTVGVEVYDIVSDGFPPWEAEHIEAFRAKHASGTRARLALELAFCTMQRRSDLVRLGRQHLRNGTLSFKQQKTGAQVDIPLLPELQAELVFVPAGQLPFLVTDEGVPFTAAGFGNWFREMRDDAGVPLGYGAHGLRKAGAIRGAEAGWSSQEIMAWGGWTTLKEVERYTKAANRKRLAMSAVAKLASVKP